MLSLTKQVSQKKIYPGPSHPGFYSASVSSIINTLWLYCAAGGWGISQRGQMHSSMGTSWDALMHLRALTSIKRDNGGLARAMQAKRPECEKQMWVHLCNEKDCHLQLDLRWYDTVSPKSTYDLTVVFLFCLFLFIWRDNILLLFNIPTIHDFTCFVL